MAASCLWRLSATSRPHGQVSTSGASVSPALRTPLLSAETLQPAFSGAGPVTRTVPLTLTDQRSCSGTSCTGATLASSSASTRDSPPAAPRAPREPPAAVCRAAAMSPCHVAHHLPGPRCPEVTGPLVLLGCSSSRPKQAPPRPRVLASSVLSVLATLIEHLRTLQQVSSPGPCLLCPFFSSLSVPHQGSSA